MRVDRVILLCFVFFYGLLSTQAMRKYRKLSTGEGLPHIYVDQIFQSNQGIIYIATHKGLVAYNGLTLTPIHISDTLKWKRQLRVNKMTQTGNQILWATNNGLFSSDVTENEFRATCFKESVSDVFVKNNKTLLLSNNKLFQIDSLCQISHVSLNVKASNFFNNQNRDIGIITNDSWGYLHFKNDKISYKEKGRIKGLRKIISDKNRLIGISSQGVWQLWPTQKLLSNQRHVFDITLGVAGVYILNVSNQGLFELFNENNRWKVKRVTTINDDVANGFFDRRINHIYTDKSGAVWIATEGNGVNILMDDGQRIIHARHPLTDNFEEYGYVNALLPLKNNELLVGSSGQGLLYWNQQKNRLDDVWIIHKKDTLQNMFVEGLFQSIDGKVWLGTRFNGIFQTEIDKEFQTVTVTKTFDSNKLGNNSAHITSMFQREQFLYAHSRNGLIKIDLNTDEVDTESDASILDQKIADTLTFRNRNLLFKSKNVIHDVTIKQVDSVLWYGNSLGLFMINKDTIQEKQLFKGVTDVVTSINKGNDAFIWVGTRNGLVKYHPRKEIAVRYLWEGRLDVNSFNGNATKALTDGRITYGCNDGIIVNDMNSSVRLPVSPMYFEEKENESIFQFNIYNYCHNFPERCFFKYQLIGNDTINAHQQGTVFSFSSETLNAGNYQLTIQTYNSRAEMVGAPFVTQFEIASRRDWRWLVIFVAILLFASFLFYYRKKKNRAQISDELITNSTEIKQNIESAFLKEAEQVILQNMSDTNFTVTNLYEAMQMSKSNFYRKLKQEKNLAPNEFVRKIKLKKAAELLKNKEISVNEVAYQTGFNTPSYFSRCFKQQFLITPKEFQQKNT